MAEAPLFSKIAVVGMGLIGSSIARAAKHFSVASTVASADVDQAVCDRVTALGFADIVTTSAAEAVAGADLVVLCVPVGAMGSAAVAIGPHLMPGAIVSDVGSVKNAVVEAVTPHLPYGVDLVPAHPVAGTEYSGPDAGFATLFEGRWCILTPGERSSAEAVERVTAMWTAFGSKVDTMSAHHHDLVLAITSHVPHLIAYNIVGTAAHLEEVTQQEVMKFSAGGFRDFTRIASSDPTMWRDVFLHNREAVLEMLGRFNEDLAALQRMVRFGDGDALFDLFTRTRAIRRGIIAQGQETQAPDFGRRGPAK